MNRSLSWWVGSWIAPQHYPKYIHFFPPNMQHLAFCMLLLKLLASSLRFILVFFLKPEEKKNTSLASTNDDSGFLPGLLSKIHIFAIYKMEIGTIRNWICRWSRLILFLRWFRSKFLVGHFVQEIREGKYYIPCLLEAGLSSCNLGVMLMVTGKATSWGANNTARKIYSYFWWKKLNFQTCRIAGPFISASHFAHM